MVRLDVYAIGLGYKTFIIPIRALGNMIFIRKSSGNILLLDFVLSIVPHKVPVKFIWLVEMCRELRLESATY